MISRLMLCAAFLAAAPLACPQAQADAYVPMKVLETTPPVFPRSVLPLGLVRGEAHIAVQIDAEGNLTDYLATAYSHPAFAEASIAALTTWRYHPALINGRPQGATIELTFEYKPSGPVVVNISFLTISTQIFFRLNPDALAFSAYSLKELDHIPVPTKIVKPNYVADTTVRGRASRVSVVFYIDSDGKVRLPAVGHDDIEANPALAAAAVAAVEQWRFEPPTRKGLPVLALARQDFDVRGSAP